jgi:hypothetical protein
MSADIGVFLEKNRFAAALVSRKGHGAAPLEGAWDPDRPGDLVIRLREHFGAVSRVALAIGLDFLRVTPVDLPAVGPVQRRRLLLLEPDKHFRDLTPGRYVAGLIGDPPLGVLMEAEMLQRWVDLFDLWAPVQRVDTAPVAAARVSADKLRVAIPDGDGPPAALGLAQGRLTSLTRGDPEVSFTMCERVDIARGAALGIDGSLDDALMPDALADTVMLGRRRRLAGAATAAALAAALLIWSLNRSRSQLLERIESTLAAEAARAAPVLALMDSTASPRKRIAIDKLVYGGRSALAVIADLSTLLPANVVLRSVESYGREWRIQGTAPSVAPILETLTGDSRFTNVRNLRPATLVLEGGQQQESFDIAFHARP